MGIGFFFALLCASFSAFGASFLLSSKDGKNLPVAISFMEGAPVNEVCSNSKKPKPCQALLAWKQKPQVEKLRASQGGNYEGNYCELLGAQQVFLIETASQERKLFCAFPDLSLVDGRALYVRHMASHHKQGKP